MPFNRCFSVFHRGAQDKSPDKLCPKELLMTLSRPSDAGCVRESDWPECDWKYVVLPADLFLEIELDVLIFKPHVKQRLLQCFVSGGEIVALPTPEQSDHQAPNVDQEPQLHPSADCWPDTEAAAAIDFSQPPADRLLHDFFQLEAVQDLGESRLSSVSITTPAVHLNNTAAIAHCHATIPHHGLPSPVPSPFSSARATQLLVDDDSEPVFMPSAQRSEKPDLHELDVLRRQSIPDPLSPVSASTAAICLSPVQRMPHSRLPAGQRDGPDKPTHECHICCRLFRRKHDLKRHLETHASIKRYVCPLCSRAFSRNDALNRHLGGSNPCGAERRRLLAMPASPVLS